MVSSTSYFHQGRRSLSLFLALFLLSCSLLSPHDLYSLFLCLWMVQPFIPLPGALLDARSTRERDSAKRWEGGLFLFVYDLLVALKIRLRRWLATCVRDEWWFAASMKGKHPLYRHDSDCTIEQMILRFIFIFLKNYKFHVVPIIKIQIISADPDVYY